MTRMALGAALAMITLAFLAGAVIIHDKDVRDCRNENQLREFVNNNQVALRAFLSEAIIARRKDRDWNTVRIYKDTLRELNPVKQLNCGGEIL